jgi:deoxyribose-phosphate aldolase
MGIAKFIDHSILKPQTTEKDLEEQIKRCIELKVYAVCVHPYWVKRAVELAGGELVVCAVVSFPFGMDTKEQKLSQCLESLERGAKELDIVMNFSALKSGHISYVREELLAIGRNTEGFVRKVIIEAGYLNEEEKKLAVELIAESGMEFVKTSTGFSFPGATEEDVKLLYSTSKGRLKVKASGGIRTKEQVLRFLSLGAERIGTSATFDILS